MILAASAPSWLVGLLFVLLLGAALEDGWRLRISNLFPIGIIALAVVAAALAKPDPSVWQNGAMLVGLLILGTLLFGARLMGGGDVKLLATSGLWFDLSSGWKMLVAVAIAGGLLAVLLLSIRPMIRTGANSQWIVLRPKGGIPYGIAIAAGVAALVTLLR